MADPNNDPSLNPEQILQPTGNVLVIKDAQAEDLRLDIYDIPSVGNPDSSAVFEKMAVDNGDGFSRLAEGGLDALQDGESVTFAEVSRYNSPGRVHIVRRNGDSFNIQRFHPHSAMIEVVPQEFTGTANQTTVSTKVEKVNELFSGLKDNLGYINEIKELVNRGDRLGEVCRALGYSNDNYNYPLPRALQGNIHRVREEGGVVIPNIRLLDTGHIDGETYVQTWAEGEFPISGEIGWFSHDATQDHIRALIVFGDDAMGFGQLYAQAVQTSETIDARRYPDSYEINKLDPQKIKVQVSGKEKIDAASICLDQFTSELNGLTQRLDSDPYGPEISVAPDHMDAIAEMVEVIKQSPEHWAQFMQHLEAVGSKALVNGNFSHETYLREILERAQTYWEITPKLPVQKKEIIKDQSQMALV